ncbi:TonB-dependent receptor [Reichenbachiella agarivorans]|uniref:TonB-dependent receptor n=1 Tax=Reichenbachiella agarivorans TaxID=2979464 RepID=A0ABY6CR67_9BACT|nr:TonB-dependent receptor [Reichenbachiella agarivorans]UXP32991.1 TonB-dependent receptor [Reichenbachiella agarivorans]
MMRIIFSLIALLWAGQALCQSADSTDVVLEEITISSDLFEHETIDFGGSVTGVTPKQINRADQLYLQPVLNAVPGVYMQSGTLSTNRITIRGIGARSPFGTDKVKAYLNEIPLSTGEGETTVEDIDFATLQGVEVYRGPTSTVYGAGLGGAIHFQTKKPQDHSSATADAMFGSFGLQRYNLSAEVADTRKSLNLLYQDVHSDGYRDNNRYDRQSITALGSVAVREHSDVTLYFNYTDLESQIPSSLSLEDYENNPESAAAVWGGVNGKETSERFRLGLSLHTRYDPRMQSDLTVFMNGSNAAETRPTFLGNLATDQFNTGLRAKLKRSFLPQNQLQVVLGVEGFWEQYRYQEFVNDGGQNGDQTRDFDQVRKYGNAFVATEYYPSDRWIISAGLNFNASRYNLDDHLQSGAANQSADYGFDPMFSPKLSILRKITESVSAYALVSHGFSLPSFEQTLYPGGQINRDLTPESGWNYELGLKGDAWDRSLYFEVVGYWMRTKDLIVNQTINEVQVGINAGSANHQGLELLLNHKTIQSTNFQLGQRVSYTVMNYHFDEFVEGSNDYSGNRMTGVPSYTLDYALDFNWALGLYGNVNYQRVGSMSILDDSSIYTDAYSLLNAKVGYQHTLGALTLNLYAGVNNLTDTKYASMLQINASSGRYYYPGLPINYFGGLKVSYAF